MNGLRRMKSFHSRVSNHDNPDGVKTWSRWYSYQLISGAQLSVDDVAEKTFGSKSFGHRVIARTMLLSLRKKLERKTGQMLSCSKGVYSLINPKEKGKIYGVHSGLEAESLERVNRNISTSQRFNSYRRSVEISIKHNPRMIEQARVELSSLGNVIKKAERDVFKKALSIVTKHTARKGGEH